MELEVRNGIELVVRVARCLKRNGQGDRAASVSRRFVAPAPRNPSRSGRSRLAIVQRAASGRWMAIRWRLATGLGR
jgi:hypothetical protein